jgi:translation initiation factor 2B subunit (eIF-2B alpha/beta/delta family)
MVWYIGVIIMAIFNELFIEKFKESKLKKEYNQDKQLISRIRNIANKVLDTCKRNQILTKYTIFIDKIDNIKIDCSRTFDYKPSFYEMLSSGNTPLYQDADNTDDIDNIISKEIKKLEKSFDGIDKNAMIEIINQGDILLHIVIRDYNISNS